MKQLLQQCLALSEVQKSRDLHFIPESGSVNVSRRLMDNRLEQFLTLEIATFEQFARFLKFEANLQFGLRLLQCGQFLYTVAEATYHLRCSFMPTQHGESVVIRILNRDQQLACHELTPIVADQMALTKISELNQGLVILSGPTGVGKTTTLYTLIEACKDKGKSVISLEDPVERQLYGVTQIQIQPAAGITYASALETALRHDPDVIVLAEIRNEHVLQMAKRAALTGHLVIATLHSGSVAQCFERLNDLGVSKKELATILRFVSTQTLLVRDGVATCVYEYLNEAQLSQFFAGNEVEYEKLATKLADTATPANYL